jgi:hypothetical protein
MIVMLNEVIMLVLLSERYSSAVNNGCLVGQSPTKSHARKGSRTPPALAGSAADPL